ncbi:MAG: hypothetical protein QOK10_74 [Pseudonocardiales bacterium]|nr:hypothetical protein [Pseudonocardiales bacterium]
MGQALISALVCVIVLVGVVWNMPDSEVKRTLTPTLQPIASAMSLDQVWRMYAPEPISRLETVEVHVTMAGGADRMWTIHKGDLVIGPFAWYRWQKLKEQTIREAGTRASIAHWVVRELTNPSEHPIRVQMVFRTEDLPAPGKDGPRTTNVETLYNEDLPGRS